MTEQKKPRRNEPCSNRIPLPFEKAIEGFLQVKPKKKRAKKKPGK
jgi:hypothetical protein